MNLYVIAADGKAVEGGKGSVADILRGKLVRFAEMPATQRRPAIGEPVAGKATTFLNKNYRIAPPPGGLVLTGYWQYLRRLDNGQLGRLELPVEKFKVTDFGQTWCPFNYNYATPGVGWMWIAAHEWKALVPADPKKGDTIAIPQALRQRLLLYPPWEGGWNSPDSIRADSLVASIEDVSAREVRLRIHGAVLLTEESSRPLFHVYKPKSQTKLPEPYQSKALDARVEGVLVYDRMAAKITRFDVVGLGDTWGMVLGGLMYTRWPVGFAYELDMSDYEPGFSRGMPAGMIFSGPHAYWNPMVRSKGYQAKEEYYVYPR